MDTVTGEQLYSLECERNSARALFDRLATASENAERRYRATEKHTSEREELSEIWYAASWAAAEALTRYDKAKFEYDCAYAIFHGIDD